MVLNSTFEDTIAAEDADYAKLKENLFLQDPKRSGGDEQGILWNADVFNLCQQDQIPMASNLGFVQMSISSWRSIGRPSKSWWLRLYGMPMYRLQMVVTTRKISWPTRGSTGGWLKPYHWESLWYQEAQLLRSSQFHTSFLKLIGLLRGNRCGKWPRIPRAFMASSISQLAKVHLNSGASSPVLSENATLSRWRQWPWEKNQKKVVAAIIKVDLYQGLKQLQWDCRKPQGILSKPICSCRLWWTDQYPARNGWLLWGDFSKRSPVKDNWAYILCHAWLQPLCYGLDQSQLDRLKETIQKVMEGKEKWLISTRIVFDVNDGKDKEKIRALLEEEAISPRGTDQVSPLLIAAKGMFETRRKISENFQRSEKNCGQRS